MNKIINLKKKNNFPKRMKSLSDLLMTLMNNKAFLKQKKDQKKKNLTKIMIILLQFPIVLHDHMRKLSNK